MPVAPEEVVAELEDVEVEEDAAAAVSPSTDNSESFGARGLTSFAGCGGGGGGCGGGGTCSLQALSSLAPIARHT